MNNKEIHDSSKRCRSILQDCVEENEVCVCVEDVWSQSNEHKWRFLESSREEKEKWAG